MTNATKAHIVIDAEAHRRAKVAAAVAGVPLAEWIEQAIELRLAGAKEVAR